MLGLPREKEAEFKAKQEGAANALRIMERHLASHEFFVGERYTVADIALYAYTHLAPEGGIDLAPYPNVQAWLARVRAQPKHVEIYG
jgi:glutathione S-transferase